MKEEIWLTKFIDKISKVWFGGFVLLSGIYILANLPTLDYWVALVYSIGMLFWTANYFNNGCKLC